MTVDRILAQLAVLVVVIGILRAGIRVRDWWYDRTGYDPLEPYRRRP